MIRSAPTSISVERRAELTKLPLQLSQKFVFRYSLGLRSIFGRCAGSRSAGADGRDLPAAR